MIRPLPRVDRDRVRWLARRQWRPRFIVARVIQIEDVGRAFVACRRLESRWSDSQHRRLWRLPR